MPRIHQLPTGSTLIAQATYFVAVGGSNRASGSIDAPFATINRAIALAKPGDIILVRGGTYEGQVNVWKGGTHALPVTIEAYPGEHPVIDGSHTAANTDLVSISASHVTFKGFEVENATRAGITVWSARDVQVLQNVVHDTQMGGIIVGADQLGVSSNELIKGNTIYHAVLENQGRTETSGWTQALGIDDTSHSAVRGNIVYDNYGEGIATLSSQHVNFVGNTAFDNFSAQMYFDNSQYINASGNIVFETGNTEFYRAGEPGDGMLIANEYTTYEMATIGDNIHDNTFAGVTSVFYDDSYGWGGGIANSILGPETVLTADQVNPDWIPTGAPVG